MVWLRRPVVDASRPIKPAEQIQKIVVVVRGTAAESKYPDPFFLLMDRIHDSPWIEAQPAQLDPWRHLDIQGIERLAGGRPRLRAKLRNRRPDTLAKVAGDA